MFRHKRRMELVELSGRITGRLGYDYRLRHRRDGIAGTTILYHLRIYRRPHSPSGTSAGRRELLEDGHRCRFRRGRRTFRGTTGRTEQRADLSWSTPRRADDTTTRLRERADASVRRPGLGARLLATLDEARAGYDLQFRQQFFLPDNHRIAVSDRKGYEYPALLS